MSASWFWESVSCCLTVWIWQWYKNCSARWLCPPGIFSFSFASSKACPVCCRTLKKEGLLHTLQSLCHHPNRQRYLLQLWQAAGPCWWTPRVGQLECCRTCSSSLALEQQCRCLGDELLQGCSTIPTQQCGGQGWEPLLNHGEMEWSQWHAAGWHVKQEGQAGSTGGEEGDAGEGSHCTAVTELAFAGTREFVPPPIGVWYSQSGTYSV